ncbi:MAG: ABC transporter permease [Rhizobiaceae bacterium]
MITELFQELVDVQRDIYIALGERITSYAETDDWWQLAVFAPFGILFGAAHAVTPGHSKTVLVAYSTATQQSVWSALRVAFILSAVHISMSILIVLLSLPLVSFALGSAGRAYLLEDLSCGLIGLIGVWMIWSALRPHAHSLVGKKGSAFAVFAGLFPCPLTLFVMTFAVRRDVTEAGLVFAAVMLIGVATVLGLVALSGTILRNSLGRGLEGNTTLVRGTGAVLQFVARLFLIGVSFYVLST